MATFKKVAFTEVYIFTTILNTIKSVKKHRSVRNDRLGHKMAFNIQYLL